MKTPEEYAAELVRQFGDRPLGSAGEIARDLFAAAQRDAAEAARRAEREATAALLEVSAAKAVGWARDEFERVIAAIRARSTKGTP